MSEIVLQVAAKLASGNMPLKQTPYFLYSGPSLYLPPNVQKC
jgi:hypothetical protein